MKKLTLLMLSFFFAMTAWAAKNDAVTLESGYYTFRQNNTGTYVSFNSERLIKVNRLTFDTEVFFVTNAGGKYTIQTLDGKFVTYKSHNGGDQVAVVDAADANDNNKYWVIREGNADNLRTIVPSTNVGDNVPGWNFSVSLNGTANAALGFYGCNDNGSQWTIAKVASPATTGRVKIKCNGSVISSNGTDLVKADDDNSWFTFTKSEDDYKYTIQTVDNKYIINNNGIAFADADAATDANKWWVITPNHGLAQNNAVDIFPYQENINSSTSAWNWAKTINDQVNSAIAYWGASDNGSYCTIEWEATTEYIYNLTYNDEILSTQTGTTYVGGFYPFVNNLPFGVSASIIGKSTVADVVDGKITKNIEVLINLPFEFADSYENVKHWYYMNVRDDGPTYAYYDSSIEYIKATEKSVPEDKDKYTWAFVGNPFEGFSIVNYAAGSTMVLSSPVAPNATQNAEQLARMVVEKDSEGKTVATGNTTWVIVAPTHGAIAENGFYIQHPTETSYAINRQGYNGANSLCYWTGRDTGSTFQVVERDMTGTADLQALIDQVEAAIAVYGEGGTTVGYYTAESVAALAAALTAAKEAAADENKTLESNTTAKTNLQNVFADLAIIQPAEGKFYTIANCKNDHRANQQIYVNNDGGMQFAHVADNKANGSIGHVFQFVPAGNNEFYLYNVQRGTFLSTVQGHGWGQNLALATENPSVMVTLAHTGTANIVYITPENSEMKGAKLHAQDSGSTVVGWDADGANDASAWVISEVADITALSHELTVGDTGYATLCLGYNATIPTITAEEDEECGVYTAAVVDGYAAMTKVEGVLPANTAVIVKAAAGTYNFNYATGEVSAIENNELKGTTINKNFTDAAYVLGVVNNEVGLYTAVYNVSTDTTNDGTAEEPAVTYEAWKNNAFKAYLPKSKGSNVSFYGFRFGDEEEENTTAIENVETATVNVIYDLSGRRVSEITAPGIYIVNGKKVIK